MSVVVRCVSLFADCGLLWSFVVRSLLFVLLVVVVRVVRCRFLLVVVFFVVPRCLPFGVVVRCSLLVASRL